MTFITEGDGDPGIVRDELRSLEARKRDLETDTPDTSVCATIIRFSSSLQVRRLRLSVIA